MQPRPAHPCGVSAWGPRSGDRRLPLRGGCEAGRWAPGKMVEYLQWKDFIQKQQVWGG